LEHSTKILAKISSCFTKYLGDCSSDSNDHDDRQEKYSQKAKNAIELRKDFASEAGNSCYQTDEQKRKVDVNIPTEPYQEHEAEEEQEEDNFKGKLEYSPACLPTTLFKAAALALAVVIC
jgi:hypothetical protein